VELEGLIPLIPSISRCGREKPNFIHTAYAPLFSLRLPEKFIPPSAEMKTVTLRFKIWFCGAGGINSFDPFNQQVWERKTKFHPYCVCALVFTSPSREIYSSFSRNENSDASL